MARAKTLQQQVDVLSGQLTALTLYLRGALDKHPHAHDALDMAESELERATAELLARPHSDEVLAGMEAVRASLRRPGG